MWNLHGGYNMLQKQKETILALLKSDRANETYKRNYWFSYKDYLDPTDKFTDFSCENLDGKQDYIILIESMLHADETAKIFVQVYGLDEDNSDEIIYADTLIVFSTLTLIEIKRIFNEPRDIFPSDIGELTDFSQDFVVDDNGNLIPVINLFRSGYSAYYCWWD